MNVLRASPTIPARSTRPGMTLVEVLAVVVILGLLAGTLVVGFGGAFAQGKSELAKTGVATVAERVEAYNITKSGWPRTLDDLLSGSATPSDSFFLPESAATDPWGNRYVLIVPGPDGFPFEVVSYGADGLEGGSGEDADVSSVNLRGG